MNNKQKDTSPKKHSMEGHKTYKKLVIILLIATLVPLYLYRQNNDVQINHYTVEAPEISNGESIRIAQVSDLHNKEFGDNGQKLATMIQNELPDVILITGDIFDRTSKDFDNAIELVTALKTVAPMLYVPGNHEADSPLYPQLREALRIQGVTVLENQRTFLEINNEKLYFVGLKDPRFRDFDMEKILLQLMEEISSENKGAISILLSHRPERFDLYNKYDADIIFSGHAHGGQIRIPLVGGVFAPHQGFFPKYTTGTFTENESTMVVSRGLGNSRFPFRINNKPEVVIVDLVE